MGENYLIKSVNLSNNRVDKMKMKIEEPAMQEMMRGVKDVDDEEEEPQEISGCWLCGREASETSDFYCEVKYCCLNHRLLHHPEDHEEPWPIVVKYKPGVGIVMIAARDIDQGELIFSEDPLVKGPNHTLTTPHCLDPLEALSFTSAVACLRCKEGLVLALDPTDPETEWACGDCGIIKSGDSISKLNDYFYAAIMEAKNDCQALEDLLTKATKMFHPAHYIPTLTRIRLNTAFLQLGFRNPGQAETELLMRRKEFLDEIHQVIETVEPGLTQRRGISLFERSACHLQLGRVV